MYWLYKARLPEIAGRKARKQLFGETEQADSNVEKVKRQKGNYLQDGN